MTFTVWLSLLFACVVISITPGSGAINTMSNSLSQGWRRTIWGILGQQLALLVHILIVAAGVGVLVASSPVIFETIRYLGAAYLAYLGVRMLIQANLKREDPHDEQTQLPKMVEPKRSMLWRGFLVNLLNPKAIVFFLAFIPQFIKLDAPQLPQYVTLALTCIGVDILVMWFFFAAAAQPFGKFSATKRGQQVLNTVFGVLFIAVACLLLFVH